MKVNHIKKKEVKSDMKVNHRGPARKQSTKYKLRQVTIQIGKVHNKKIR